MLKEDLKSLSKTDITDILCCCLLIAGILYSPFLFTVALIFMVIRILFIGNGHENLQKLKNNILVTICLLSVYILNLAGMLWSSNIKEGLFELNHKLPFLILPLFFLVTKNIKDISLNIIIKFYVTAITVGIIIGLINYIIHPYADTRLLIPHARNISFALNICFASFILIIHGIRNNKILTYLPLVLLFIAYIFVAQLLSGIITLLIIFFVFFIILLKKKNKVLSVCSSLFFLIVFTVCIVWTYKQYNEYFTPKEDFYTVSSIKTEYGNPYRKAQDKSIENGYYVSKYQCPDEVNAAWKERTGLDIMDYCIDKEGKNHYHYYDVIYRYLNSKGLKKDRKGVMALNDSDIENIKKGYSNYVYAEHFSLRPRLYQTFYEFERYIRTGEIEEMSLIQRYFWSKNAINIISNNLIIGTGTGDTKDALTAPVIINHPELCSTNCNPHNQFIYTTAALGLMGLVIMIIYILYLPIRLKLFKNKYFIAFFVTAICWMFTESSFESYEGMTFISALMSFFCFNCTRN